MHPRAIEFAERARDAYGIEVEIHEFDAGTSTARDAAAAIGCEVGQIASSLVFRVDDRLVVVVTSGANRVDTEQLADRFDVPGGAVSMADPDEISETVGWSIGGVPPLCHDTDLPVLFDDALLAYDLVWAAAGTPEAVFPIAPGALQRYADAAIVTITHPTE